MRDKAIAAAWEDVGLRRVALVVLCAFATYEVASGVYFALQYSQDFQWSPATLFVEGIDPFAWHLAGNPGERIIMSQEPNYLPLLYELLAPFAWMSWPAAKAAWALANVAMGLGCALYWTREAGLRGAAAVAVVATFLAASPFAHTLGNGQQSLLALAALTCAWALRGRGAGGVGLAVGATKYSLALPVALWLLLERRGSALVVAVAATLGALALFVLVTGADPIDALFEPLRVSAMATHVGLADAMSFVRSLDLDPAWANNAASAAGLAAAGLGVALVWRARARLADGDAFALLCLVSLFSFFHNLYDYVLLLPLFCRALRWPALPRAAALAYVGFFWFAVQVVEPWLKSSAAIGAMALASAALLVLLSRNALGEIGRIVPDAPDESGAASRQPGQAEEIKTGHVRDAALVRRPAALVEGIDL